MSLASLLCLLDLAYKSYLEDLLEAPDAILDGVRSHGNASMSATIKSILLCVIEHKTSAIGGHAHDKLLFWSSLVDPDFESIKGVEIPSWVILRLLFFASKNRRLL